MRESPVTAGYEREFAHAREECVLLCRNLQEDLRQKFGGRIVSDGIPQMTLEAALWPWARGYYEIIGRTLFRVLAILQPEDFKQGPVSFYVWPLYHSYLANKALFFHLDERRDSPQGPVDLGLGLRADPQTSEVHMFHECRAADWYAWTDSSSDDGLFWPTNLYSWFIKQEPRTLGETPSPLESVTVTTHQGSSAEREYPEHLVLPLKPGASQQWGQQLCDFLNGHERNDSNWQLPDRLDRKGFPGFDLTREAGRRNLRQLLLSLFFHSAFCSAPPDWWRVLTAEIATQGFPGLAKRLAEGFDVTAWHDRPAFTSWTALTLATLVAPPPYFGLGPWRISPSKPQDPYEGARHIGWAAMLCSIPLRPPFLLAARRWLVMIYAILRYSEISILWAELEVLAKAAVAADSLFHDLYHFITDSTKEVIRSAADSSQTAIDYRCFAMSTIHSLSTLLFDVCGAVPHPEKRRTVRDRFLKSLSLPLDDLRLVLRRAAWDAEHWGPQGQATVILPDPPDLAEITRNEKATEAYASALLLTSEIVRNYVQHGPDGGQATWQAAVSRGRLSITLEGPADSDAHSHNFALLHHFLSLLSVGRATSHFDESKGTGVWEVEVNLEGDPSAL